MLNLARNDRMTRATLDSLATSATIPEVADFLQRVKRRYQDQWPISSMDDLQSLLSNLLSQPQAALYKLGDRYYILSPDQRYLVVLDERGTQIIMMEPTVKKIQALGGVKWLVQELLS